MINLKKNALDYSKVEPIGQIECDVVIVKLSSWPKAMEPDFAAGFLGRMRPDAAAAVMAGLTPETAYSISVILAGRNATAPKT